MAPKGIYVNYLILVNKYSLFVIIITVKDHIATVYNFKDSITTVVGEFGVASFYT
jgi:hypothetical protein